MDTIDIISREARGVWLHPRPVIPALAVDHVDPAPAGQLQGQDDDHHAGSLAGSGHAADHNAAGIADVQNCIAAIRQSAYRDPAGCWVERRKPER